MFRGSLKGTLRLGVIPAAMPQVARLTAPFCTKHENVTVDMQSITSVEIQRGLDKFELDACITYLENKPLRHQLPLHGPGAKRRDRHSRCRPQSQSMSSRKR